MVLLAMIILKIQSSTGVLLNLYIINEFFQLVANGAQYHPARDYDISGFK